MEGATGPVSTEWLRQRLPLEYAGPWNCVIRFALAALLGLVPQVRGQEPCTADWRLTEGLRIGSLDGPDALTEVRSLAISPNGDLYVTQYLLGSVTVFSADGKLVRTIGRTGQGPGEFENAPSSVTWRGDTLWEIARRHNTSPAALRRANNLSSTRIHPGDALTLPNTRYD